MLKRAAIRARLFPLAGRAEDDLSACTTAAERVALVAVLTREAWALSKRVIPDYQRSELPITVIRRRSGEE